MHKAKAGGNSLLSPHQFRVICHAKESTQRGFTWVGVQEKLQSLGARPTSRGKNGQGFGAVMNYTNRVG